MVQTGCNKQFTLKVSQIYTCCEVIFFRSDLLLSSLVAGILRTDVHCLVEEEHCPGVGAPGLSFCARLVTVGPGSLHKKWVGSDGLLVPTSS